MGGLLAGALSFVEDEGFGAAPGIAAIENSSFFVVLAEPVEAGLGAFCTRE